MKKAFLLTIIYMAARSPLSAQKAAYVNYNAYNGAIPELVKSIDTTVWKETMLSLRKSAMSLHDEAPAKLPSPRVPAGTRVLSDEELYDKRKSSVVVIGRLMKAGGSNINFEIMGTGFAISKEGVCVTNHHVLQSLLQLDVFNQDLIYFVITEDRKCYIINRLLSYSQNNDLAVFSVRADGRQFAPIPLGKPAAVGAPVYCISHPAGVLYYFSKGMVARNESGDSTTAGTAVYDPAGKTPIRMEVTADYGAGSSGGPIFDRCGNLVGIVAATSTIYYNETRQDGVKQHPQMVVRPSIPVKALTGLLQ